MATIDPQTILLASQAYADAEKAELSMAMNRLESMFSYPLTWVSFADRRAFEPEKGTVTPLGGLPVLEKAVFNGEFSDPIAELEKYKTHIFIAPYLDSMQALLMNWVNTGGVGISDDVQTAMFDNMRERDLQNLADALDAAASVDSKRGFMYPRYRRAELEIIARYTDVKENRNREITILIADLAQKNAQFAITSNISIEKLQADFAAALSAVFYQLKNRILEKFRIEQEARIAEFTAKLQVIEAGYKVENMNAQLEITYQEQRMKAWEAELQTATERGKALIQEAMQRTEIQLKAAAHFAEVAASAISASLLQTNGMVVTTSKA